MASLLDLFGGGFTPINAQGVQAPMGFMDTLGQNRNSLIGLGLGLMGGTRDDPMGPALRGYQAGAANDQNALYRQYMMKKAAEDKAYRESQDKLAQSNWERSYKLREQEANRREVPKPPEGHLWNDPLDPSKGVFAIPGLDRSAVEKPPAGYEWKIDPDTKQRVLSPIEGGPATHLPAETAGRLGLMQAAKPGLEEAKKYFLDESKPGPLVTTGDEGKPAAGSALYNAGKMALGQTTSSFEIGRQQRNVRIAVEAALRTATGAAAPEEEVKRYTNMYAPTIYDDLKTRKQKLDALERFIDSAESTITRGRVPGGSKAKADPWGIR